MQIEIRTRTFRLTDAIRSHIERRLSFALDRFSSRIRAVLVWVKDLNGPRHGRDDKCCHLVVELNRGSVVLEERAPNLYLAIDRAAHRLGRQVARQMKRAHRPASVRFELRGLR